MEAYVMFNLDTCGIKAGHSFKYPRQYPFSLKMMLLKIPLLFAFVATASTGNTFFKKSKVQLLKVLRIFRNQGPKVWNFLLESEASRISYWIKGIYNVFVNF